MTQTKVELIDAKNSVTISGSTPSLTIGDAGAEDTKLVFDGNAQDFHIGLDDSADDLLIGLGSTVGTTPAIAIDENLQVNVKATTASSSATTGALIVGGGAGIAADLSVGDDLRLISDAAVIHFGADSDITMTHVADTGLTIQNSGNAVATLLLKSTDADEYIGPSLHLHRDSANAADNDETGQIVWRFDNDAQEDTEGFKIKTLIKDASNGTEDFQFDQQTMVAGSIRSRLKADGTETVINEDGVDLDFRIESQGNANMVFVEASADRLMFSKNGTAIGTVGMVYDSQQIFVTRSGNSPLAVNRLSNDGTVFAVYQAGSEEGGITVSGSTVAIAGFTGVHWSRLADNSKPTILRGTIMESLDTMMDWYQAFAEVAEATDENGHVTPAHEVKEPIALGSKSVGDAITFTSRGTEYTGKIIKEGDVKHTKCKISDTADSKKVYGVFSTWDDADDGLDGDVNDMHIAQVGTYIIRVNKDVTVSAGDLLVSNGDGTAKKQDDDIIRSKTVAKVNSNVKIETYSDGSYTVPCTLHC